EVEGSIPKRSPSATGTVMRERSAAGASGIPTPRSAWRGRLSVSLGKASWIINGAKKLCVGKKRYQQFTTTLQSGDNDNHRRKRRPKNGSGDSAPCVMRHHNGHLHARAGRSKKEGA